MPTKDEDIKTILKYPINDILREVMLSLPDWQVTRTRQRLEPRWQDGFHGSLFDLWYNQKNDEMSGARKYFKFKRYYTKTYPEQGWAPDDTGSVGEYQCNLCDDLVDDDDIMLNHFRNGFCKVFNDMVESTETKQYFWQKMNLYVRKADK